MQIIESNAFSVRSAIINLESSRARPTFVLFPMIHVGEPEFYSEISSRLNHCDYVLYEGVKSRTGGFITASYRFFADSPRLKLVSQNSMKLGHLKNRLIHADVTGELFESNWWALPSLLRYLIPIAAPLYGIYMRYFGTRSEIAKHMKLNDLKSRDEILGDDDNAVASVMLDWRDQHLLDVIDQQIILHENSSTSIGVLYGAKHMRAVIRHLAKEHGYKVVASEWVNVFMI